jgi:type VI secretion system protein ImpC
MSQIQQTQPAATDAADTLIDQVLQATSASRARDAADFDQAKARADAEHVVGELVRAIADGGVAYDGDVLHFIEQTIAAIDRRISTQLDAIVHDPKFLKLEGSWRGLWYLVDSSRTGKELQIKVLPITKDELLQDFRQAKEEDQSRFYKQVYEAELGSFGGTPFTAIVGDYEWTNTEKDLRILRRVAKVCEVSFAPFLTAASPRLFGLDSFTKLPDPRDLAKIFTGPEYDTWRTFRRSPEARFVAMTLPRALARTPYGEGLEETAGFHYQEAPKAEAGGRNGDMPHDHFCWMNAAYTLAARISDSVVEFGWPTSIRGRYTGGAVYDLPSYVFESGGEVQKKCPVEVSISYSRENELSQAGFLPLLHYRDSNEAVFIGAQTPFDFIPHNKAVAERNPNAAREDENLQISGRLPYLLATGRFAHYMKQIGYNMIGSSKDARELESALQDWINNYTKNTDSTNEEDRARYPLREARISVLPVPGKAGVYSAKVELRPWLQMEELTASMSLVTSLSPTK